MLQTQLIQCPYCWETIELVIDPTEPEQHYVEDCFVCCRPIHLNVFTNFHGQANINACTEDDDMN